MSFTTLAVVGVLLWLLYRYITKPYDYWKKRGVPYTPAIPILGSMLEAFGTKAHEWETKKCRKYGRIHGYFEGSSPALSVAEPSLVKNILVKDFMNFTGPRDIRTGSDTMDHMLFFLSGESWKRVRTILSPIFTTGKIKKILPIVTDCAATLTHNFSRASKKGGIVNVKAVFGAFAMDLIACAAFATKIDSHNDPSNAFVVNAKRLFGSGFGWRFIVLVLFPKLQKLFRISFADPKSSDFFSNIVKKIVIERKRTGEKKNDFIQLMMEATADAANEENEDLKENSAVSKQITGKKELSHDELVANAVMFFFVGYETSSSSLSFATYMLALNPDCQEKLIAEVDDTFRKYGRQLTYENVQEMKYMDMVVSETLRMFPIAISTEREAQADYKLGDTGITIPKGMIVHIPIYAIHYDPEFYDEPEKFKPERFTPEAKSSRDAYTYIPFSAGPRNCIGMRLALFDIKACLAYIMSQFRFKTCSQTKVPPDYLFGQGLLQPKEIILKVEERKDKVISI